MDELVINGATVELPDHRTSKYTFSQKPPPNGRYRDNFHKIATYAAILGAQAQELEPSATARTFPVVVPDTDDNSPFRYIDDSTSNSNIVPIAAKLEGQRVAIVGLGGTGSYVLDFVSKTPVAEIHIWDGDQLLQHNAFRSPGAASRDELAAKPKKVDWLSNIYDRMHSKILVHPVNVVESNVSELGDMDFVFVCIDSPPAKKPIFDFLISKGRKFIDVGMGLVPRGGSELGGTVRTVKALPNAYSHLQDRVSTSDTPDDAYSFNIQIAELNALNAALAVISWKKELGFYSDEIHELSSFYRVDRDEMVNEDCH